MTGRYGATFRCGAVDETVVSGPLAAAGGLMTRFSLLAPRSAQVDRQAAALLARLRT